MPLRTSFNIAEKSFERSGDLLHSRHRIGGPSGEYFVKNDEQRAVMGEAEPLKVRNLSGGGVHSTSLASSPPRVMPSLIGFRVFGSRLLPVFAA